MAREHYVHIQQFSVSNHNLASKICSCVLQHWWRFEIWSFSLIVAPITIVISVKTTAIETLKSTYISTLPPFSYHEWSNPTELVQLHDVQQKSSQSSEETPNEHKTYTKHTNIYSCTLNYLRATGLIIKTDTMWLFLSILPGTFGVQQ